MDKNYEEIYSKMLEFEAHQHAKNYRKIQIGIKVNIFLPLVFLLLSFAFPDSGFFFLMLWIISLFGIAFYLIYVEYRDYKTREKLLEFGLLDEVSSFHLMGNSVEQMEQAVDDKLDEIERKLQEEKKSHDEKVYRLKKEREAVRSERIEKIKSIGDKNRGDN